MMNLLVQPILVRYVVIMKIEHHAVGCNYTCDCVLESGHE